MARTKVFDPDQALEAALSVFSEKGFEGTSTEDLLRAMNIGRQSMYDTFGDKKQLYLAALARYAETGRAALRRRLAEGVSPLAAIRAFLDGVAKGDAAQRARGCLAVNAVAEFGQRDADVAAFLATSQQKTEALLTDALAHAREGGELPGSLDAAAAAHFLHTAIRGMRISAKAGASAAQLAATVDFTMTALKAASSERHVRAISSIK